ncbi:MAG TPA: DUF1553 domain-containing protein, partial [Planctomycetaceae bacterium]|nr:DUF1553 domain-containing protein [Planctomycetaceae bacterium]
RSVGPTMLFDVPARQVCTVKQARTNTPLHALTLMNDIAFVEAARKMAERVLKYGGETDSERIVHAFRLATARTPGEGERATLEKTLTKIRKNLAENPDAADQLLSVGESPVAEALDRTEIAAYASLMNLILNLDEVLTKE